MAKKKTQIIHDEWDTYVSDTDNGPLFISFDVEAARDDLTDSLGNCARVIIPVQEPNESGGPVPPESDLLYQMEDRLCGALAKQGVDCRLVARLTCAGFRELVFQLDDWKTFRPIVGLWMVENEGYEIDVSEHEGWDFFNDVVRPSSETWLYLADRGVVQNLIEAGSDPKKAHALEFVFHGQVPELKKMLKALEERGYKAHRAIDPATEELITVKKMKLDVDAIYAESLAHQELADAHEAVYDGWGAAVVE
jgi:regulator of RNase E activity RraB